MECPEAIDLMADALEGGLATEMRPGFDEHLAECDACRNYFEQLGVTVQALERLGTGGPTSPRRADLIVEFKKAFDQD